MHMRVYVTDSTLSVSVVPDFHVALLVFNFTDITAVFVNIMSGEKKNIFYLQDAQLSQRNRAAGCVIVFAKSRTLELGDNDLRTL